jgi:hypothetical protein
MYGLFKPVATCGKIREIDCITYRWICYTSSSRSLLVLIVGGVQMTDFTSRGSLASSSSSCQLTPSPTVAPNSHTFLEGMPTSDTLPCICLLRNST